MMPEAAFALILLGAGLLAGSWRDPIFALACCAASFLIWITAWYALSSIMLVFLASYPDSGEHWSAHYANIGPCMVSWAAGMLAVRRWARLHAFESGWRASAFFIATAAAGCYYAIIYRATRGGDDTMLLDFVTAALSILWVGLAAAGASRSWQRDRA